MTLLAKTLNHLAEAYTQALARARAKALDILTPRGPIPRKALEKLYKRALRNGAWHKLTPEQKSLLLAATRTKIKVYRSNTLIKTIRSIWLQVELATTRGKAILTALAHIIASVSLSSSLNIENKLGLDKLVAIGLQALNHPFLVEKAPITAPL